MMIIRLTEYDIDGNMHKTFEGEGWKLELDHDKYVLVQHTKREEAYYIPWTKIVEIRISDKEMKKDD